MASVFKDPKDEDKICQALKAFVEEWGAEYVTVSLPESWRDVKHDLGRVKLEFTTVNSITIKVKHQYGEINYVTELAGLTG